MQKPRPIEFVLWSDHHAHNFPFGAKPVKYGDRFISSRLKDSLDTIDEIAQYGRKENIDEFIFLGDLFHSRRRIDVDVSVLTYEKVDELAGVAESHLMPGNHDMHDRDGWIHSLLPLEHKHWVHDRIGSVYSTRSPSNLLYSFVPYRATIMDTFHGLHDSSISEENVSLLFGHLGIQGARVGSDYVLVNEHDIAVPDIPHKKHLACFFGHYHEHQQVFKNGWYVGATHHHNWGDANTVRGFIHLKVWPDGTFEFEHIPTQAAARFIVVKQGEEDKLPYPIRKKDFVRYYSREKVDGERADKIAEDLNAGENIHFVEVAEATDQEFELAEEELNPSALVKAWVKQHGEDRADLVKVGHELLGEDYDDSDALS